MTAIYAFHCGGNVIDFGLIDPDDPRAGSQVYEPYLFFLIRHRRGDVLFDAGLHPALIEDPAGRLGERAAQVRVQARPSDTASHHLRRVGVEPRDISQVVVSHLHYDHAGGLDQFPHAETIVQARELAFARAPAPARQGAYMLEDLAPRVWQTIDGEHDVLGDGSILVTPTPGHTPGHQSLLVRLGEQTVLLLGDAAPRLEKLRARVVPPSSWDAAETLASWDRIEELEAEHDALLVCTHETAFLELGPLAPDCWRS